MIDPRRPVDDLGRIGKALDDLRNRVDQLSSPTETMRYQSVAKLEETIVQQAALINDLEARLDRYIEDSGTYTKAQVDAMRPASPGSFTVNGALEVNGSQHVDGTFGVDGLIFAPSAYGTLDLGRSRRTLWISDDGRLGTT